MLYRIIVYFFTHSHVEAMCLDFRQGVFFEIPTPKACSVQHFSVH